MTTDLSPETIGQTDLTPVERRILAFVQANPASTQTETGLATGIPQQSVSRTVKELLARGFLVGGKRTSRGRRGHPSLTLSINPDRLFSLGVSIMADAVALMLIDMTGAERGYTVFRPATMSRQSVLDCARQGLDALCGKIGIRPPQVFGIGVGITGFVLPDGRSFNTPRSLDEWANLDVAAVFQEAFGRPAWADNDGNVAAIGESLVGVGKWARNFAYLYISTGFGGGIIANGQLLRGRHGNAGEFAQMLPPMIYPSPTLELLRQTMAWRGVGYENVSDLLENFSVDQPGVAEWVAKVADTLTLVCGSCHAVLDPDAIVLGGRMPRALAELVIPRIAFHSVPRRGVATKAPPVVPAAAPGDATALGAAAMPLKFSVYSA
ncbi:MAG TPA: ROK family transcriptional regulator [Pedomonas sp.]|nr:ROK family transcriptional regulator [Pedomonas sp.]